MPGYFNKDGLSNPGPGLPSSQKGLNNANAALYTDSIMAQSQISRTFRDDAACSRIIAVLSQEQFPSRRPFARRICVMEFPFLDARGCLQPVGCMKAPATLAEASADMVPPSPQAAVENRPRQLAAVVPEPVDIPGHPARIRDLAVMVVTQRSEREVWNTLMAPEHPHGMTAFAGCQVRYLCGLAPLLLGAGIPKRVAVNPAHLQTTRSYPSA